jgi:hypothetical protein
MPTIRHPWIPERAHEDGIELVAQHRVPVRGHRHTGLQIVVSSPGQGLDLERPSEHVSHTPDRADGYRHDVFADAVAGDYCEAHGDTHNAQCTMHNAQRRTHPSR